MPCPQLVFEPNEIRAQTDRRSEASCSLAVDCALEQLVLAYTEDSASEVSLASSP